MKDSEIGFVKPFKRGLRYFLLLVVLISCGIIILFLVEFLAPVSYYVVIFGFIVFFIWFLGVLSMIDESEESSNM